MTAVTASRQGLGVFAAQPIYKVPPPNARAHARAHARTHAHARERVARTGMRQGTFPCSCAP